MIALGFEEIFKILQVQSKHPVSVLLVISVMLIIIGIFTQHALSVAIAALGTLGIMSGIGIVSVISLEGKEKPREELPPIKNPLYSRIIRIMVTGLLLMIAIFIEYSAASTLDNNLPEIMRLVIWGVAVVTTLLLFYISYRYRKWVL